MKGDHSFLSISSFAMYNNVTNSSTKPPLENTSTHFTIVLSSTVLLAIFSPIAVIGNVLVCAAIWRNSSLRTPSYILLAGLAFTDVCNGLFLQPIIVANGLIYLTDTKINLLDEMTWPASYITTKAIGNGCGAYCFQVTMLLMTFMSIERWLHMTRRSFITIRRTRVTLVVLLVIPIPLAWTLVEDPFSFLFIIASISLLVVCLALTSVAYYKVFRTIRRHQQQIHANELQQNFGQPAINFEKYRKSVFTILYILAAFYACFLPIAVAMALALLHAINESISLFLTVSTILVYLYPLINPLLYLWRMKDIRNEVRQLVKNIFRQDN